MRAKRAGLFALFLLVCIFSAPRSVRASEVSEFLRDVDRTVERFLDPSSFVPDDELRRMLFEGIAKNHGNALLIDAGFGCKCQAKRGGRLFSEPAGPLSEAEIVRRPDIFLIGDSLLATMAGIGDVVPKQLIPVDNPLDLYYPDFGGERIRSFALGGSTSRQWRAHFDYCGGGAPPAFGFWAPGDGEYREFYPNPANKNHVQLENRRTVMLLGGNDLIYYEPLLRALPWLTPFRINFILNNYNRIVSYHQAQGAQLMLVSQQAHPSMPFNILEHLSGAAEVSNLWNSLTNDLNPIKELAWLTPQELAAAIAGTATLGVIQHPSLWVYASTGIWHSAGTGLAFQFQKLGLDIGAHPQFGYGWLRADQTWLSQQLGFLSALSVPFVVHVRKVHFANTYFAFADGNALLTGKWWAGNPTLYESDSVHFSHPWGHGLLGRLIQDEMLRAGWDPLATPSHGDRCTFTSSATFPSGQPAGWTEEPPPLPEASDEIIWLIILCFLTGHCNF